MEVIMIESDAYHEVIERLKRIERGGQLCRLPISSNQRTDSATVTQQGRDSLFQPRR